MHTTENFTTKKSLQEAVASGRPVKLQQPFIGGTIHNGTVYLEGPHYPQPHTWYAKATVENGLIVKVR